MPTNSDQTTDTLTIDEVASPWHVRYRNWLVAGAVAGGLVALGRLGNKRGAFVSNPLQDHQEEWRLRPMDIGPLRRGGPKDAEREQGILQAWWEASRRNYGGAPERKHALAADAVVQLYNALGRPVWIPNETMNAISYWLGIIGINILNVAWLFEFEGKKASKQTLRHLWYAIKIPELAALSPDDQKHVCKIIDNLPERERWRVKFFYDQSNIHLRASDWTPSISRHGREIIRYHASHIDTPSYTGVSLLDALELPYKEFVGQVASSAQMAWAEVHDRLPDNTNLLTLSPAVIAHFDKKVYLRALRYLKKSGMQEADRVRGAVGLMLAFGSDWKRWLVEMEKKGIDAHDATYWLPRKLAPGLGAFLRRRVLPKNKLDGKDKSNFVMIASRWNDLPDAVKRDTTANIITFITSNIYDDVQDGQFAVEAARWGVSEEDYKDLEQRYLAAQGTRSTIPGASVTHGDLTLFKLDRDDPRGLFLGAHTACCQAPGLEAEECAWHGVESPYGAFFAVENKAGEIIAQAWTWRNQDVVVFDNIEGPGVQSHQTRELVIGMYKALAQSLLKADQSIFEVRIGTTEDRRRRGYPIDWGVNRAWKSFDGVEIIPPPLDFLEGEGDYSDSSEDQFILAKRGEGTRYFKSAAYMDFLAKALQQAWKNDDLDALEFITKAIVFSPFHVEPQVGEPKWIQRKGALVSADYNIDICLSLPRSTKFSCAFSFNVYVVGKFTSLSDLGEYKNEEFTMGVTVSEQEMLERFSSYIDIEEKLNPWEMIEDLMMVPRQTYRPFDGKYIVAINMEEFRGYDKKEDAQFVASILEGIDKSKYHGYIDIFISLLRHLDEEEVKEYEEKGYLDELCHELEEDEWWCWD